MLELGYAYLSSLTLTEVAQPHMEALVAEVNESSSISVLDELDVVYVVRVPTRRIMSITLAVGTRLPAYATSMGRVLLAALTDDELDRRLARADLRPLTARTVTERSVLLTHHHHQRCATVARVGDRVDRVAEPGRGVQVHE